jgi:hypothetical protein
MRRGVLRGRSAGESSGVEQGAVDGSRDGAVEANARVAAAQPLPEAASDPAYEDDAGAYDPSPPAAGSYGSFEEFCADQPEETECGGAGDPAPP